MSYYIPQSLRGQSIINNLFIQGTLTVGTDIIPENEIDIGKEESRIQNIHTINLSATSISTSNLYTTNLNTVNLNTSSITSIAISTDNLFVDNQRFYHVNGVDSIQTSNGNVSLSIQDPFDETGDTLNLKLATTLDAFGNTMDKIFVNADGDLDISINDFLVAGDGISKKTYIESIFDFGLSYIPGIDNIIPDLNYISASIDTSVLDFKGGQISIKSQGIQRVPFFDAFGLTSDSKFLFDTANNKIIVDQIEITDVITAGTNNLRVTNKQYVDNLNETFADRPIHYTQDGNSRIWDIRLLQNHFDYDTAGNLRSLLIGQENGCVSVNPDHELVLSFNNTLRINTSGQLLTTLQGTTAGCLGITPDNEIELNYNINQFRISNGSLQSTLQPSLNSCIQIDPDNNIDISYNASQFFVTGGNLNSSLKPNLNSCIQIDPDNNIDISFNPVDFNVSGGNLNSNLSASLLSPISLSSSTLDFGYNPLDFNVTDKKLNMILAATSPMQLINNNISLLIDPTYLIGSVTGITFNPSTIATMNQVPVNTSSITALNAAVSTNTTAIATHTAQIATNSTGIATNSAGIAGLSASLLLIGLLGGGDGGGDTNIITTNSTTNNAIITNTTIGSSVINNISNVNSTVQNSVISNTTIGSSSITNISNVNSTVQNSVISNTTIGSSVINNISNVNSTTSNAIIQNTTIGSSVINNISNINTTTSNAIIQNTTIGNVMVNEIKLQAPTGDPSPVITSRLLPAGQGASNERSELILFHSNDGANGTGEDLITLRAPALRFQTYNDDYVSDIDNDLGSNTRMYINPAGNVGIGTTDPGSPLHVAGTMAAGPLGNGVHMGTDGGTYSGIQLNNSVGTFIDFSESGVDFKGRILYTNSSEVMDILTAGVVRLTLGTTLTTIQTDLLVNGQIKLQAPTGDLSPVIASRLLPAGQGASNERSELILFHGNDGSNGAGEDLITLRAPALRFQTYTDPTVADIDNDLGSNTRMYINPVGNVGIGTTDPGSSLHVAGIITAGPLGNGIHMGTDGGTYSGIQLNNSDGTYIDFSESGVDYKGRILYTNSTNVFDIYTNGLNRMSIGTSIIQNAKSIINGDYSTGEFLKIEKGGLDSWGTTVAYDATRYIKCLGNAEHTKDFNVGPGGVGIGYAPPLYSKAGTDGLYISGNVGIGTNNPQSKLHIIGDIILTDENHQIKSITGLDNSVNVMDFHEYGKIRFYTGNLLANQIERMSIEQNGDVNVTGNFSVSGNLTVNGIQIRGTNHNIYYITTSQPLPDNTWTRINPSRTRWNAAELSNSNGLFTNNLGRTIFVTINYNARKVSNGFGYFSGRIRIWPGGTDFHAISVGGPLDFINGSTIVELQNGQSFGVEFYQNSGSGNNISQWSNISYSYQ